MCSILSGGVSVHLRSSERFSNPCYENCTYFSCRVLALFQFQPLCRRQRLDRIDPSHETRELQMCNRGTTEQTGCWSMRLLRDKGHRRTIL